MASKPDDPASTQAAADEVIAESKTSHAEVESENEEEDSPQPGGSSPAAKKKKSKKKRIKAALGMKGDAASDSAGKQKEDISKAMAGLSNGQIQELLSMNPSLAQELAANSDGGDLTGASIAEQMKKLKVCSLGWGSVRGRWEIMGVEVFQWSERLLIRCHTAGGYHDWTCCNWEERQGDGLIQVLADTTGSEVWRLVGDRGRPF
jgi:hypothetical protein